MSPRARALIGVITTVFFAGLGIMLLLEQRYELSVLLGIMALIRGFYAVGQVRWAFGSDDDELEEEA